MKSIAVMGAGSWGISIALLLNKNGHKVTLWSWTESDAETLKTKRQNSKVLPDTFIPENIEITNNIEEAIKDKQLIVMVVPSKSMRENITKYAKYITKNQIIVTASKGIEENTLYTMTEIIHDVLPENIVAAISGPSHAEEVSRDIPTTCVVACKYKNIAEEIQTTFMNSDFRVYTNPDVLGVELGGSLKNIIALACGMVDGLKLGDNTKAALMTRGMAEIVRLGLDMKADIRTFYGLSGIGDLIVTCGSMHSRNRRAGILLGQGKSLEETLKEVNMVVEGIYSVKAAIALSKKYNVQMPIVKEVEKVLFQGKSPRLAVEDLMNREKKEEYIEQMNCSNLINWSE